ncbi:CRISPR-associated protein Cas8b/Csh1, subtype I-B/HMARI [Halorubrum xinjiangense]|uniref:CRISPR-associated protein Cas8b/Csh1, subtype I-B/HMARI n=1 Tax=Halorubrum xinjiangense TaxID=261291 RepID=A0A1G7SPB8_9EURY|nr:CRISPR-associated protein Cas8b/Csh1, subtype I-B/HMARI [Halorubrum xinjiangense]
MGGGSTVSTPTKESFQEAIEEYWHDRPPASFEDVMALYGVLAVAESGGELYTTSSKLDPFVDEGRLITVDVNLTGDTPAIEGFDRKPLREDDIPNLGYSHKSSGRGAKYSLTQIGSKNGNDADGVAGTILSRVRSWTGQDRVQSVTGDDGHPDGWIIDALEGLFEKDSDSIESLKEDIVSRLPADESIPTVLTFRFRVDTGEIKGPDDRGIDWVYPGDIDVLDIAMRRYATGNAADKNIKSGTSEGDAVGVVTGSEGHVVGTPESPLGIFSVKHPDAQPALRKQESWRNYPVSEDVAMLFSKGQDLVEACVHRNGGMETYALPYFAGELTAEKAQLLYRAIDALRKPDDDETGTPPMARVTYRLQDSDDESIRELAETELRFYMITMPISDDKNIVAEESAADTYWLTTLADALVDTRQGATLDPGRGGFTPFDGWPLLDLPADRDQGRKVAYGLIAGHEFTNSTFAYRDEEGDDFRRIVDHRLIAGTPIEASVLFQEYLNRYEDASEDGDPPPAPLIAQQLVQLEALSRAGLLNGLDVPIEPDQDMTSITQSDTDMTDVSQIRKQRLKSFLERPLFDSTTRRAAAVSGVLVGQVSWYQENQRGIGRPLDSKTAGDELTANGLENALTSALEKAKIYAHDSEYERDVLFPETVDELLETTEEMPTKWDIDKRELRFCYVLGHAHGRRSMPVAFDLREDGTQADTAEEQSAD